MRMRLFILLFLICCVSASVPAVEMPEFGKSVQFDKKDPQVTIDSLKGKVVLVLFYQEW